MLFEDGRVGSISSNHLGGDAARDAQKESPGLVTKARSHGRPSFYAITTSFSSSDDGPYRFMQYRSWCRVDQAHGWYQLTDDEAHRLSGTLLKPTVDVEASAKNLLATGRP